MTNGENIEYAISKCVSEYSFIEWLETWDISRDDWKTFMDAGRTAVDGNKVVKRWIYHPYYEQDGECVYECPVCGMGSDYCDYAYCMRCGTKLDRAKKGNWY